MPGLKNNLSLHEAIVIALININKENFSATFEEIAQYLEKHNLFEDRKGNISLLKRHYLIKCVSYRNAEFERTSHFLFTGAIWH